MKRQDNHKKLTLSEKKFIHLNNEQMNVARGGFADTECGNPAPPPASPAWLILPEGNTSKMM